MIEAASLNKTFKVFDRREGVRGALKDLFERKYRDLKAVNDLTFKIAKGEIVGLIGPNGAGKSTTVKMLTGILHPTSGRITVNGLDPFKDRVRYVKNIGVVFGQRSQLWWDIAVIESFTLLQKIYDVNCGDFDTRMKEFQQVLDIEPLLKTPVRKLSLGERMRCDLAASLLHNPPVLYLDEPTIGLDLIAKDEVRNFLQAVNKRYGTTIVLTTHDLSDIEQLCERVMVIDHGKLIFDDELSRLKRKLGDRTTITVKLQQNIESMLKESSEAGVNIEALDEKTLKVDFLRSKTTSGDIIKELFGRFNIRELEMQEPEIEEVVRDIYRQNKQGGAG